MLLSAIVCCLVSVIAAKSPKALIIFALLFTIILLVAIFKNKSHVAVVLLIFILCVIFSTTVAIGKVDKYASFDKVKSECVLTVMEITYKSDELYCADVKVLESNNLKNGTKLSLYYYSPKLNIGDTVKASLELSAIKSDYKMNYYSRGIYLSGRMREFEKLDNRVNKSLKAVGGVREYIKTTAFKYMDYESAATLCALLFGDDSYFSPEFYNNVKCAGVSHVMVVSGMHLTILVTFLMFGINKFFHNRYVCAAVQLFSVFLLCAVCGFTMSIMRAGVMYIIASLGLILKRRGASENTLGAAVSIILIFSPFAIFNVSFQLSVLSTFGILGVALTLRRYIIRNKLIKNSVLRELLFAATISLSATLLTLPVVISIFGYVSTVGVITTLIITYPVTISIWLSILGLIVNLFSPFIAKIIFIPCNLAVKFVNYIINRFGKLPFSTVEADKKWVYVSIIAIIFIFWFMLACKKRIDMIKLKEMRAKIIKEGGRKLKWR